MEQAAVYVKNIFCLYIVMTILDNMISDAKYSRYIKLFSGLIMILVVIRPVVSLAAGDGADIFFGKNILSADYAISEEVYANILEAEGEKREELILIYTDTIAKYIENTVSVWGFELVSSQIDLDLDMESDSFGRPVRIKAELTKINTEDNELYGVEISDNKEAYEDFNIISIKNNLANFYNLPVSNIYINIIDRQE